MLRGRKQHTSKHGTTSRETRSKSSNTPPQRLPFRAARAFYLTLLIGASLACLALFTHHFKPPSLPAGYTLLQTRSSTPSNTTSLNEDEQCRLVHHATDQCAFIHTQCPTSESGFSLYLDLYYCRLPHLKPLAFTLLISWLGLLFSTIGIAASDFFCINLSTIATILGMSESMAGVTFLAFGNGSPDVFSTFAAMSTNSGSLAVGELFGAAGFITAVVAGSMALIRPFHVARKSFIRDVGFFVVAAAFSIGFLWDGKLRFWECVVMVLYYCFYVGFVVVWHWFANRRRRRRERERAAREHHLPPEELDYEYNGGDGTVERYRDDPDEAPASQRPTSLSRGASWEDWAALERGGEVEAEYPDDNEDKDSDEEEEARDRWMSELNSNMRLTRPPVRPRMKSTLTPVRPSLVGALEFQAVLKSLQKSRNLAAYPLSASATPGLGAAAAGPGAAGRRYSDDPTYTTAQQQDYLSANSEAAQPASRPPYEVVAGPDGASPRVERRLLDVPSSGTLAPIVGRNRSASALDVRGSDARGLRVDADLRRDRGSRGGSPAAHDGDLIDFGGSGSNTSSRSHSRAASTSHPTAHRPSSPNLLVPPIRDSARAIPSARTLPKILIPGRESSHSQSRSRSNSRTPSPAGHAATKLSPFPGYVEPTPISASRGGGYCDDPSSTSPTRTPIPAHADATPGSHSHARGSSYHSHFHPQTPARDVASPESLPLSQTAEDARRPTFLDRYWPHNFFPPPGVLISTLFPTIYHWREKSWWECALGLVAAPSVFLLTVTLPVVESGREDEEHGEGMGKGGSYESGKSGHSLGGAGGGGGDGENGNGIPIKSSGTGWVLNDPVIHIQQHEDEPGAEGAAGQGTTTAQVAVEEERLYREAHRGPQQRQNTRNSSGPKPDSATEDLATHTLSPQTTLEPSTLLPDLWNRWLLILQTFTAPLFIVLAIYSQSPTDITPVWLVKPSLISLLISLLLLLPLLLTTTPSYKPPAFRYILSIAGFVVSIAWISTIAAQVVGALKALAVILNMSHAIMGLTIFAVGNSLGDLVADVTVARLGYPVMALSACLGGPMLNILLGIGLSGSYILLRGARHRVEKHPDKDFKFKSYHIEVSNTLIVSGVTLLVTLVGLGVAVPWNAWIMGRRLGWCLIALWCLSTVGNVVVEVTGLGGGHED